MFRLNSRIELGSGYISGIFPIKQSKITHFHVFRVNSRNLSVYLSFFQCYFLIKRNFSAYLPNHMFPSSGSKGSLFYGEGAEMKKVPGTSQFFGWCLTLE